MIEHIKPLPISEEMLGAYLEGNLSQCDAKYVEQSLHENKELSAFVDELFVSDNLTSSYLMEDVPNFENDFTLPKIPAELGTYIEPNVLPFGFEPSIADVAACACMPDMTISGDSCDIKFEDNMPNHNDLDEEELGFNLISKDENFVSNDSLLDSDISLDMNLCNDEDLIDDNYFDV